MVKKIKYVCTSCGSEVIYHTDIAKIKAPKKCSTCNCKKFKKAS